ncbi:response regulator [Aromatoleum toluolicum]|uniref:Response regulator n=1 Tax=Aromatoleum toluolicum TaxID=90060 RepID=Q8VPU1_9RHOO|nr:MULTISPECIES: response regulator [Rhodocyclales]AAK50368.1 response regulator [Aromatoleum toluolicum]ABK15650.1 TdiR [Azoarcus sp. CIB]AKU14388.1 response regulator [Azoarcus sp. CIB]AYH45989.1 DNA-binding response regulator [Azoarcus sp. DN11]NMF96660.1 response regulator [Aromatoleum toluolicum]
MQVENLSPTVFVVDDEESVRHSLSWLLGSIALDVKMYDSPQAFLDADISGSYGCLILDVRMQALSGLQLQEILCQRGFNLPIIFLSAYGDAQMGAQAIKKGAIDFLQKPYRNQDLLDAVNAALTQSKEAIGKQSERDKYRDCLESLSLREKEIFDLVVDGNSSKEIARLLGISPKTVEAHRGRLMSKLGVRSLGELIQLSMLTKSHCLECKWASRPAR